MSLTIYLTTDEKSRPLGGYRCLIWTQEPVRRRGYGADTGKLWVHKDPPPAGRTPASMPRLAKEDLASLGFPEPGEMRVHEIGEYEEGKDDD